MVYRSQHLLLCHYTVISKVIIIPTGMDDGGFGHYQPSDADTCTVCVIVGAPEADGDKNYGTWLGMIVTTKAPLGGDVIQRSEATRNLESLI
jgi:hypothetical protein